MNRLFTSESVTEGHPDKVCDQISDAVLDAIIGQDPKARVACESAVTTGLALVMGEITTDCYVDIPAVVRDTIRKIGYDHASYGFDANTCAVLTSIDSQSPDIALGVDKSLEVKLGETVDRFATGAGDQGMMFGFACDQTPELMPMPIALAHSLCLKLAEVRRAKAVDFLRPDGKSQVTIEYENGKAVAANTVVISTQHSPDVSNKDITEAVTELVIKPVVPKELMKNTRILVNPTGRFVVGGPQGDSGLTGRKIIVDTYGGYARHGGGAFSGKDPTKVDRSAAYAARYVAKNIVAAGLASSCEIELAYAIGVAKPVSILVETFGTGKKSDEALTALIQRHFDLRPEAIIEALGLRNPIFKQTAAYGHFGRNDLDLPWERLDKVDVLKLD